MIKDQVFQDRDGWKCIVNGKIFGIWARREYALAGMKTEQRRAERSIGAENDPGSEAHRK